MGSRRIKGGGIVYSSGPPDIKALKDRVKSYVSLFVSHMREDELNGLRGSPWCGFKPSTDTIHQTRDYRLHCNREKYKWIGRI